jgi:hypothetical protein
MMKRNLSEALQEGRNSKSADAIGD